MFNCQSEHVDVTPREGFIKDFKILYFHHFLRRSCEFKCFFSFSNISAQTKWMYRPTRFPELVLIHKHRLQFKPEPKFLYSLKKWIYFQKTLSLSFVMEVSCLRMLCVVPLMSVTVLLCVTFVNMSNIVYFLCMILCIHV